MKKRQLWITVAGAALCANTALAQTTVGGPILTDTTWLLSGSPYELAAPVLIGQGATLTIDPGVEVHFLGGKFLSVGQGSLGPGALVARGTPQEPIRFTSPLGLEGSWDAILFPDVAVDAVVDVNGAYVSGSILENCIVEYGGGSSSYEGAVEITQSAPLLQDTKFQFNARRGLYANGANGATGATPAQLLRGCEFRFNTGGGPRISSGSGHQIKGCLVEENGGMGSITGPGLYLTSAPDCIVEDCIFRGNTGKSGAGMYASSCAQMTLTDCLFEENAGSNGGGLYLSSVAGLHAENLQVLGNTATSSGGGAYISSMNSATVSMCTFQGNSAASNGGGLFLSSGSSSSVQDCHLFDNSAGADGGGLSMNSCSSLVVEDCLIERNDANRHGGGLYWNSGSQTLLNCAIQENSCEENGGGIYANAGTWTLDRTTVSCNDAVEGGGGLYIKNGSPHLDGDELLGEFNTFQGNTATMGDAIFNDRAFSASGTGDTSLLHICWGAMDPNTVPNRLWDFFDDPSLGIMLAANYASCGPIECGCLGTSYCVTSPNSVGNGALIGYTGTTSIVNNDLTLTVSGCPGSKPGLFFYGPSQIQVPFGDGQRCVGGALTRLSVIVTDPSGDGSQLVNYANQTGTGQIVAGSIWNFQFWYRDPAAGGAGFNVSDGLKVQFCQ